MNKIVASHPHKGSRYLHFLAILPVLLMSLSTVASEALSQNGADCEPAELRISINLRDVDISVLINTIAEITGKNVVIDSGVNATVTVDPKALLSTQQLYDLFLSIAEVHDLRIVDVDDKTILIAPNSKVILESTIQSLRNSR